MTIFLVVSFVTFLDSLVQVAPAVFYLASQQSAGDFDLQIQMRYTTSEVENGNTNFYTLEKPMYSRFDMTEKQIDEKKNIKSVNGFKFANYTLMTDLLKDDPYFDGAFPRWVATTKLINPDLRDKNTSAVAIIGDSKKERDIGVAPGFTTYVL